ncbi:MULTISPECIES: MerR family transcriptional regulator [Bacillus]|uniref:MerR family transcriptional regulator n=1 Tax=Bacillus pumilus (strain SAFR-032) TaxID=315750 RepID=A8FBH2_BACP2|nr:MerR family transcriptional regulator [Bacillus pumilus]MCP1147732.1 MerR family transcriptional regulator [Bacillus sp. 1735sda2]ABV61589.1 MerR family transcriptional regulator [Bacillus pumilus SAFR-032]AVI40335.1 MerR family DNA-binding transcriptional regulator [Bacillus pumilus]MBC3642305.1 MerR family transcriptional regulator [Bacillus pumilus]MBC3647538.1 MerR family transcriptional regulator [Bacillus pumilus]
MTVRRRCSDGAEKKYRIGELAQIAQVTKRTVDYYTNLGLLAPVRSCSNYRYYDEHALKRLQLIVLCKQQRLALSDIKSRLDEQFPSQKEASDELVHLTSDIDRMNEHMDRILVRCKQLEPEQREKLKEQLTPEKMTAVQSFLLLLS